MILEVYAGKNKIVSLVQYYDVERIRNSWVCNALKGYVAIPGGNVRDEKTVRKWANEQGYKINKVYEAGIDTFIGEDYETSLLVS